MSHRQHAISGQKRHIQFTQKQKKTQAHGSSETARTPPSIPCPKSAPGGLQSWTTGCPTLLPSVAGPSNWLGSADSAEKHIKICCDAVLTLLCLTYLQGPRGSQEKALHTPHTKRKSQMKQQPRLLGIKHTCLTCLN